MECDSAHLIAKAALIADHLYRSCVAPDGGQRLRESGTIPPGTSLKQNKTRKAFEWVTELKAACANRYFTLAACQLAIEMMLKKPGVRIPHVGLPHNLWLVQQARLIKHLCRRARKSVGSRLRFTRLRQSRTMDWQQTVPMDGDYQDGWFEIRDVVNIGMTLVVMLLDNLSMDLVKPRFASATKSHET